MSRFHRGYLLAALILAIAAFLITLYFFPEWATSIRLLLMLGIMVIGGVLSILANWRTAFDPPASSPSDIGVQINAQRDVTTGDFINQDKITNITYIQEASTPLALSLHQLPPPPHDFTGREAELKELLAHIETGAVISGLRGQGGIGKTALALELAKRLTPRYPDAQFYLDLKGVSDKPLTPAEALAHIIRAYHPTNKLPESETELRALYLSVLHEKRALLLMDNAKDAAQMTPLIPPATCYLLITSRQRFHLPGLFPKDLEQMPPDEARDLLLKIAQRMGEHANSIANLCGHLPLALRLTASALAERVDLSPADLIRKLNDAQTRLKLTGVEASLQLSYDLLTAELQKLWRALAVFPDTFDRAAVAAVWELEEDAAHDALGELVKFSLLDFSPHPAPLPAGERESLDGESPSPSGRGDRGEGEHQGRYHLHDLARLYADSRLPDAERYDAQKRHAGHYLGILQQANKSYLKGSESTLNGLTLFDLERKNIQSGQIWVEANARKDKATLQLCSDYPDAGFYILEFRQHPRKRIQWLEAAVDAARRLKDRRAEGVHLGNLGSAYGKLGEFGKVIEFSEQALVISRKISDRRNEGAWLGNLGNAYAKLGEFGKAIKFYEQVLVINREISDRRGEGMTLVNFGNAYANLGEFGKAFKFYELALVIAREIGDRSGEGRALWNMSLILDKLGERTRAIAHAEAALKIHKEIEDPNTEKVRNALEAWRADGASSG